MSGIVSALCANQQAAISAIGQKLRQHHVALGASAPPRATHARVADPGPIAPTARRPLLRAGAWLATQSGRRPKDHPLAPADRTAILRGPLGRHLLSPRLLIALTGQ